MVPPEPREQIKRRLRTLETGVRRLQRRLRTVEADLADLERRMRAVA